MTKDGSYIDMWNKYAVDDCRVPTINKVDDCPTTIEESGEDRCRKSMMKAVKLWNENRELNTPKKVLRDSENMPTTVTDNSIGPKHYTDKSTPTINKIDLVLDTLDELQKDFDCRDRVSSRDVGYIFNFLKYFDRLGDKDGEPAAKDARKCANYIYRLAKGVFVDEVDDD